MKVLVNCQQFPCNTVPDARLDIVASGKETVRVLIDRIVAAEPTPFPCSELRLGGKTLREDDTLADCGVVEGSCLSFIVHVSEEAVVQQLRDLLKTGALSIKELGLVYCHRHGVTASEAVKAIGKDESLRGFLERQKSFSLDGETVTLSASITGLHGDAVASAVAEQQHGEACTDDDSTSDIPTPVSEEAFMHQLCEFLQTQPLSVSELSLLYCSRHGVPVAQVLKKLGCERKFRDFLGRQVQLEVNAGNVALSDDYINKLAVKAQFVAEAVEDDGTFDVVASEESFVQQLCEVLQAQTLPISELGFLYCARYGVPVAQVLKTLGGKEKFNRFLERQECFTLKGCCVEVSAAGSTAIPTSIASTTSTVMEQCDRVLEAILGCLFLSVQHIAKGGFAYTGSTMQDDVTAEVVLFLCGLPPTGPQKLLRSLSKGVSRSLRDRIDELTDVRSIWAADDAMRVNMNEGHSMNVRFAAVP